ncbi:hypothetical protein F0562_027290 [Nyssa sinensis]|uniref:Sulfotransferase n=1 Tax=Nyssa sinensis TaxID=561372 RepID=A0A5J5B529_9ASTE|nr:hypothetical protein F0562_027290 [Nyssa sinensis]
MAEDICFFHKDQTLVIKAPKKSPLLLRLVVLFFAMVCGVYICSICLKQTTPNTETKVPKIQLIEVDQHQPACRASGIEQWEIPFVHFPKPKSFNREECACNPVRLFAIFIEAEIWEWMRQWIKCITSDWFTSASKNECSAAIGFKWMLNQGLLSHHKEIAEYFNKRGVSAVFLFRRNLLRRMVSMLANSYDKGANSLQAHILAKYKPKINISSLIPTLKEGEETTAKAMEYFKSTRHIVLYYEDIVRNRTKLVDVLKFLRVPYRDLTSRQVKIHSGPLSNQVQNWDDVQNTLKGTPYESLLQADYKL